jgi:hypothetical protein
VTRRVAALALAAVAAAPACGEKEEHAVGPSRAEVQAVVADALAAVGANAPTAALRFRAAGRELRVRLAAPPGGAVGRLLTRFDGARAEIAQFCPKPALLRCRPALRAWAVPHTRASARRAAVGLLRAAARTYAARPLLRRRGSSARVVTANGELLAEVARAGPELTLSFGGLDAPRRRARPRAGGLELEAGPEALAALRPELSPPARRALAGVTRLLVWAQLPRSARPGNG